MATATDGFSWFGYDALERKLRRLVNPDASELMEIWTRIIEEDNARGIMAGLDKDGHPFAPVRYRTGRAAPLKRKKLFTVGEFKGLGAGGTLPHNNLTTAEYKKLTGPPLAPRGLNSRVIINLETGYLHDPANPGRWEAVGAWRDVVSPKGVPFLPAHFHGTTRLPIRDARGVRPWGREQAKRALRTWVREQLRG